MRTFIRIIILSIVVILINTSFAIYPELSSNYTLCELSNPDLIKGKIMGTSGDYKVLRYEDVAFITECFGYISLADSSFTIPRVYTSPEIPMYYVSRSGITLKYPNVPNTPQKYNSYSQYSDRFLVSFNMLGLPLNDSTNITYIKESILMLPWEEETIQIPNSITNRILKKERIVELYQALDKYKSLNYITINNINSANPPFIENDINNPFFNAGDFDVVKCSQDYGTTYQFSYDSYSWIEYPDIETTNTMIQITSQQGFYSAQKAGYSTKSYYYTEYEEEENESETRIVFTVSPMCETAYTVERYTDYPQNLILPIPLAKNSWLEFGGSTNISMYVKDCIIVASCTKEINEILKDGSNRSTNETLYIAKRITAPPIIIDSSRYGKKFGMYVNIGATLYTDSMKLVKFAIDKLWNGDYLCENPIQPTERYDPNYNITSKSTSVTASIINVYLLIGINYPYTL